MNDHNEPMQEIVVTFKNKVKKFPGNEKHLHVMLESYLRGKGITLKEDNTIEV